MNGEARTGPAIAHGKSAEPNGGPSSTAAVLWLMITLVFVPIVGMHLVALWANGGEGDPPAAADAVTPR